MSLLRNFLYATIALLSALLAALGQENNWSWTAPDPPLPDTWYWDYGWDSTSNGIAPAEGLARREAAARPAQAPLARCKAAPRDDSGARQSAATDSGVLTNAATEGAHQSAATSLVNGISVSPYYTVGFEDFNGKATSGVGLDVGLNLSKTVQVVSFVESDDVEGSFVDRFGLGLQLTGKLGRWLKPFARLSVGYNFEGAGLREDKLFVRPQFGAILDVWKYKSWHASLTGSWALDVDTDGNAAQRLFGGIVLGTSF